MSEADDRPEFIKKHEVSRGTFTYGGKVFTYAVLDQGLEPALPGFVGYYEKTHLFISNSVPEKFRIPQLIHEIVEFAVPADKKGRCLKALMKELECVETAIFKEYLLYRKSFFTALIDYYENGPGRAAADFIEEIKASCERLSSLACTL